MNFYCMVKIKCDDIKNQADLPIMTRPTLDLGDVLMRITQKEMRQVMVFERERV